MKKQQELLNELRLGAIHSSLHSTLSVLEGILEYERNGYSYRLKELEKAQIKSQEFILMHKLFRSDKTGKIINLNFLKLCYPPRYYYDILKAMDYFQFAKVKYDNRMDEAIRIIINKKIKMDYGISLQIIPDRCILIWRNPENQVAGLH